MRQHHYGNKFLYNAIKNYKIDGNIRGKWQIEEKKVDLGIDKENTCIYNENTKKWEA